MQGIPKGDHGFTTIRPLTWTSYVFVYTYSSAHLSLSRSTMSTASAFPGAHRAHQHNRQRALEAVQNENTALTRFLFETIATDEKSQKTSRELLSLLEKQDRNLEGQLAEVQQYVLDRRAALEAAKLAFEHHLKTQGRANDGHLETISSINRLASLEDKKHISVVSRGQAEHSSATVKERINVTRRERLLFDEMRKKYRKELGRIGGEMVGMLKECTERMASAKKNRSRVARLREVARQEEEAWACGWREQILRMEAFTECEGRGQRARAEEKRARALELVGGRGGLGRAGKEKGANARPKLERGAGDAMAQVAAHIVGSDIAGGGCEPPHLAIVRAFNEARATGVANQVMGNVELQAMSGPEPEPEAEPEDRVEPEADRVEATADTADGSSGASVDRYRRLIERLCETAGLSPEVDGPAGGEAAGQLLTLLAMIELVVLVNTANPN